MGDKPLLLKQVHALIDSRTTILCLDAAGQIQPVDEPFDTLNGKFFYPPFHIGCRDWVSPWMPGFVSEARELANAEMRRRPKKDIRKGPDGFKGKRRPPPLDSNRPVDTLGRMIRRRGGSKEQESLKPPKKPVDPVVLANAILANKGAAKPWQLRALEALLKLKMDPDDLLVAITLVMFARLRKSLPKWLLNALRRAESV